jgi:hypothetical protein
MLESSCLIYYEANLAINYYNIYEILNIDLIYITNFLLTGIV